MKKTLALFSVLGCLGLVSCGSSANKSVGFGETYSVFWVADGEVLNAHNHIACGEHPKYNGRPTIRKKSNDTTDFLFNGRWLDQDGIYYSDKYLMPNHNVIFEAQFNEREREDTVTFQIDVKQRIPGDLPSQTVKYYETVKDPGVPDHPANFKFLGWYYGVNKDHKWDFEKDVVGDYDNFGSEISLYGNWEVIE